VTPSAWSGSIARALQVGTSVNIGNGFNSMYLSNNAFFNGTNWTRQTANTAAMLAIQAGTDAFVFQTAATDSAGTTFSYTPRMTLDASGNLLVGTTDGNFTNGGGLKIANATAARLKLCDSDQGVGSGDGFELTASGADAFIYNYESGYLAFGTGLTERARITSGGRLLVGTTTENASGGVIQVSNGITFPATQSASSDANTLDDYEEGTWTPTLTGVTGGSLTYSQQVGRYVKIGNCVYVTCRIAFSAYTHTGGLYPVVGGFPFTSQNVSNQFATNAAFLENVTYTGVAYAWNNPNEAGAYLASVASGGAFTHITGGNYSASSTITFEMFYWA